EANDQEDDPAEGKEGEAGGEREGRKEMKEEGEEIQRARRQAAVGDHQSQGEGRRESASREQSDLGNERQERPRRLPRLEGVLQQETLEPAIEIPQPPQLGANSVEIVAGSHGR